jgi:hypothetical protein
MSEKTWLERLVANNTEGINWWFLEPNGQALTIVKRNEDGLLRLDLCERYLN